jgi:hypothetical protein
MKQLIPTLLILIIFSLYCSETVSELLIKADELYFNGDLVSALETYFDAEKADPDSEGAKTGIYNAAINSGRIETANKYAYKLLAMNNSLINQDRVVYSDALLGRTTFAEKLLKTEKDYFRKKSVYSLAGWGLSQTGYYRKTAEWYDKAVKDGFKDPAFIKAGRSASEKNVEYKENIDIIFSLYDHGGNELLEGGYNFNINYNFGPENHKFNLNLVMQGTSVDQELNDDLGFLFYDDIGQYELFGQYNYLISPKLTVIGGGKLSWLVNDYIQNAASATAGLRFFSLYFRAEAFINASSLSYNTYEFTDKNQWGWQDKDYLTSTHSMSSVQYNLDAALTFKGFYAGGVLNIVSDKGDEYAENMKSSDRDSLLTTTISENIADGGVRYLYGATAGYSNADYDIFTSYTTGDIFLVHTGQGRYLNTNDSKLRSNIMGGVVFNRLFGDWILGYTFSYSDFENYTIMTNSIIANYSWR